MASRSLGRKNEDLEAGKNQERQTRPPTRPITRENQHPLVQSMTAQSWIFTSPGVTSSRTTKAALVSNEMAFVYGCAIGGDEQKK